MNTKYYLGTAGWSYKDWEGIVYPKKVDQLEYLASYINTIEINSSFYRIPSLKSTLSWVRKVEHNADFKFTAKIFQDFTHKRSYSTALVDENKKAFEPMLSAAKLGTLLLQFPWSFKNTDANRNYLEALTKNFQDYPLTIEIRHSSWNKTAFYEWLVSENIGFCNIDQPLFYNSIKPSDIKTNSIGYVRLHGRNYDNWFKETATQNQRYNYLYTKSELKPWVEKIQSLAKNLSEVYVIANNHYKGQALVNTLQIMNMLTNDLVKIPPSLVAPYSKELSGINLNNI